MIELAGVLADKRYSNIAKCIIILDSLGGKASTSQIKAAGVGHGLRAIKNWNIAAVFAGASTRIARLPDGWLLLPEGERYLAGLSYKSLASSKPKVDPPSQRLSPAVFIGHGGSPLWRELKDFVRDKLGYEVLEFNSECAAGLSTKERLQAMLGRANAALLLMTAEDERADGSMTARMNVIHEVGLFQGKLGFEKAVVMLEEGCAEFSNIHGIVQIRFPKDRLKAAFEEVRDFLEREL